MIAESAEQEDLRQVWEHANEANIIKHKIKCIPWVHGELAVDPSHDLLFEGPFDLPFSSKICLANLSEYRVHFDARSSSTCLSVFPCDGTINPCETKDLIVIRKPFKSTDTAKNTDTIIIREAMCPDGYKVLHFQKTTTIKCVYNTLYTTSFDNNAVLRRFLNMSLDMLRAFHEFIGTRFVT
ncbi:unnamed protein product [Dicrocoelium dendriticum]|nr:unnamed protein product [Dicrocoelium dendriticum]